MVKIWTKLVEFIPITLCPRCNKVPMHCNKCVEMSKHVMVFKERAKREKWSNYKSLIKKKNWGIMKHMPRNHWKKGKFQATSINFATTHTFVFKLYTFFLLSREKVWIWEPFFFLFRFELLIMRFNSFLTYLCIATFCFYHPLWRLFKE